MFGREPVLWLEAARALIVVAVAFGLKVSEEQLGLIMVGLGSVFALIARSQVTPVPKPAKERGDVDLSLIVQILVIVLLVLLVVYLVNRV